MVRCFFFFFKGTWHHFSSGITSQYPVSRPAEDFLSPSLDPSTTYSRFNMMVQMDIKHILDDLLLSIKNGLFVASSLVCKK